MDFTLSKYEELLRFLIGRYRIYPVEEYLLERPSDNFVILRHDVDRSPTNALKMAELENRLGVQSTYYFRYPHTFKQKIIKKIVKLGHEVGYHYETLSKAKGDYEKAIQLFEQELQEFRKLVNIQTICMHGSPLSKFDNKSLWERYNFRGYGVIGEAYLSINDPDIFYLTDTGRNWENRNNVRDRYIWQSINRKIKNTDHLIEILAEANPQKLYMTVHPERWGYNMMSWSVAYFRDAVFNLGKKMIKGSGLHESSV